jgi:Putative Flp pilus-assembly TadE/G-like
MWGVLRKFAADANGAVAATVALSLFALVAVGGIAFDYARVASMDTELQQAADQAALAAATQLDGQPGARARALAAAQNLIANSTLFASGGSRAVTVPVIKFCPAFDDSVASTLNACAAGWIDPTPASAALDAAAHVVWVQVGGRTADYALTPIVGAISSGTIGGEAVASMNSAVCKEPPVMMCNLNSNPAVFDYTQLIGKGIRLVAHNTGAGGGAYVPGDFGYLDVGAGVNDLKKLMGYGSPPNECVDVSEPATQPGDPAATIDQFNTRFDIYESGDSIGCFGQSKCPPSLNSRKDVVMNHGAPYTKNNCGLVTGAGSNGWKLTSAPYRPVSNATNPSTGLAEPRYVNNYTATPDAMGYPRDRCHAINSTGNCTSGRIGTGDWDIDTYWRVNHFSSTVVLASGVRGYPTTMNSTIRAAYPLPVDGTRSYPTRYQVYRWEMANAAAQLPSRNPIGGDATLTDYGQPICKSGLAGSTPGPSTADRRTIPIAVINCTGLTGAKPVDPIDWVDSFLVEPAINRSFGGTSYTNGTDIYVEVIGHTGQGTGGTATQFVRHDRPYLIR